MSAITAAGYLDQLRDFAFAHQIPELLEYVSKSKAVVCVKNESNKLNLLIILINF